MSIMEFKSYYYPRMLRSIRIGVLVLTALVSTCLASTDRPDSAVAKANKVSSLTALGAESFHLKFTISEPTNPEVAVYRHS